MVLPAGRQLSREAEAFAAGSPPLRPHVSPARLLPVHMCTLSTSQPCCIVTKLEQVQMYYFWRVGGMMEGLCTGVDIG